jgi:hypothetical protein
MPDVPIVATTGVLVLAFAIFFGRLRHESPLEIALNAGGWFVFVVGLGLASELGREAFLAAALASGGMAAVAEAVHLGRRRRDGRAPREAEA